MTLIATGSATIDIHRGQYGIGVHPSVGERPWRGNGLLEAITEGTVSVLAGTGEGPLRLTVETHDGPPPLVLDDWEEVVEVSEFSGPGLVAVSELMQAPRDDLPQLRLPPNSWIRIRGRARGRDEAAARDRLSPDEDPIEEHLLQMWPAPEAEDVCHRVTDEVGQIFRSRSQVRPA